MAAANTGQTAQDCLLYAYKRQVVETRDMVVLKIDLASATPVYRQIADGLRARLVLGSLKPGDQLPTVRQLAIDLTVHHNTVAQAYRILADEGWIELRRRNGARVVQRRALRPPAESKTNFSQRLRELIARAVAEGLDVKTIARKLATAADEFNN